MCVSEGPTSPPPGASSASATSHASAISGESWRGDTAFVLTCKGRGQWEAFDHLKRAWATPRELPLLPIAL
jgi:hypothetical protein